ncbi:MAG: tRNA (adenosine(37)-N6)-threonylcarbamoyltransferase complex ATPase subunit type 1 TsaE [Flavobacteriales bacterium]|nr:tRNA (adenosine(37)-N6)-threonylcarbamoyltransferase complex ATPase subunit type 1 TsaE [Flavobacteriales bacterium]
MEFKNYTLNDLPKIATYLLKETQSKVFFFNGNLGAGKTTLIKEIVKQLGSDDDVSSPTFSVVNEYHTDNDVVYHFDLYRMKSLEEILDFGFEEYIFSGHYCFIEWTQLVEEWYDESKVDITIENTNDIRKIAINNAIN